MYFGIHIMTLLEMKKIAPRQKNMILRRIFDVRLVLKLRSRNEIKANFPRTMYHSHQSGAWNVEFLGSMVNHSNHSGVWQKKVRYKKGYHRVNIEWKQNLIQFIKVEHFGAVSVLKTCNSYNIDPIFMHLCLRESAINVNTLRYMIYHLLFKRYLESKSTNLNFFTDHLGEAYMILSSGSWSSSQLSP